MVKFDTNSSLTKDRIKYEVSELYWILPYLETNQKSVKNKNWTAYNQQPSWIFKHNLTNQIKRFKRGYNFLHVFVVGKNNLLSLTPLHVTLTKFIPIILLSTLFRLFNLFISWLSWNLYSAAVFLNDFFSFSALIGVPVRRKFCDIIILPSKHVLGLYVIWLWTISVQPPLNNHGKIKETKNSVMCVRIYINILGI